MDYRNTHRPPRPPPGSAASPCNGVSRGGRSPNPVLPHRHSDALRASPRSAAFGFSSWFQQEAAVCAASGIGPVSTAPSFPPLPPPRAAVVTQSSALCFSACGGVNADTDCVMWDLSLGGSGGEEGTAGMAARCHPCAMGKCRRAEFNGKGPTWAGNQRCLHAALGPAAPGRSISAPSPPPALLSCYHEQQ